MRPRRLDIIAADEIVHNNGILDWSGGWSVLRQQLGHTAPTAINNNGGGVDVLPHAVRHNRTWQISKYVRWRRLHGHGVVVLGRSCVCT